jgi:hypothetical protein
MDLAYESTSAQERSAMDSDCPNAGPGFPIHGYKGLSYVYVTKQQTAVELFWLACSGEPQTPRRRFTGIRPRAGKRRTFDQRTVK